MNSINLEQLLGLPLNSFEKAYYTLYGNKLTEIK